MSNEDKFITIVIVMAYLVFADGQYHGICLTVLAVVVLLYWKR